MTAARPATETVAFVDAYAAAYRDLFSDVRSFDHFTRLHVGLISDVARKSLPAIGHRTGADPRALHHFIANADWDVALLRQRRLQRTRDALRGRPCVLCIDETGDQKYGAVTDYVSRHYIGNLGAIETGLVSVNAYGVLDHVTFPLLFQVFKPNRRLKPDDTYRTKPTIASDLVRTLFQQGFAINLVLADAMYGESSPFIQTLHDLGLSYVVAIRQNHGMLLPPGVGIRFTGWRRWERVFSDGTTETRYIREVIYGIRRAIRFYELTSDPETLLAATTRFVMTNLPGDLRHELGNLYGLRTWIEYGSKHIKNELGWADHRLTDYYATERWWDHSRTQPRRPCRPQPAGRLKLAGLARQHDHARHRRLESASETLPKDCGEPTDPVILARTFMQGFPNRRSLRNMSRCLYTRTDQEKAGQQAQGTFTTRSELRKAMQCEEATMAERSQALAEQFEQAVAEFIGVLERLSDEQCRTYCPNEERSVAVVARHVAFAIPFEMDVFREIAAGRQPATITRARLAEINAGHAREWADCSKHEVLALLRDYAAAAAAEVRQLNDEQLARAGKYVEEISEAWTVEQWIERILIGHVFGHLRSIREAVAA